MSDVARILVTGASKGIGRAISVELAARGHHVVATARDPRTLADLPVAQALRLDVTDQASVDAAVADGGPFDVLVSNAGEIVVGSVEDTPLAEFERLFAINTFGAVRVAQAVIPAMRHAGTGRLVFVSSVVGRVALPMVGAYAATKWALEAAAETLAIELRQFGISVTLLQPGTVSSGALDAPTVHSGAGVYRGLAEQVSFSGDMIGVEDVARATADAIENGDPRLRIPVGASAELLLGLGRDWPDNRPFEPRPLDW
jgi:NAD(P)-dependent dehydrogenase (short-subunit alcohol dehydrogenase family)